MDSLAALSDTALPFARETADRLAKNPRDPDALVACAALLAALGRRAEAIACLDRLTEVAPTYPGVWRLKAHLYAEMGDAAMAERCAAAADREDARWRR